MLFQGNEYTWMPDSRALVCAGMTPMRGHTGKLTDEASGQPETSDYWFRVYSISVTTGQSARSS